MAIKAGQIVHAGNGVAVIDRIQTGGPGQLNIPTEKIYELGNYKSVATVRDTPDLTFTAESFDVSNEFEALLTGQPAAGPIDLATSRPVDIASQFKAGLTAADPTLVTGSVALPFLYLEQMSYRFGLRDNATMSATLRGDTIFYNPGATFVQTAVGTNTANQSVITTNPAYQVAGGDQRRILSVTVGTKRLSFGADYTESYGTVTLGAAITTLTILLAVPATENIRIVYASPTSLQYPQSVHPDTTVKPAAVKGRDIEIYVGGVDAYDPLDIPGSAVNKLTSVQSVQLDWRVTIEKDEEFGNYYAVGQDFETPVVNGSIEIKPRDDADFRTLLRKVTGVTDPLKVIGPDTAVPLELHIVVKDPETGDVIKRLFVEDARFTAPGFSGRVQQKLTVTMQWESDEGTLILTDA
jgi:hypothetical protein